MEGQLTIRKNKRIGTVILIVEGEDEEFKLLKRIFHSILGYTYISINKEGIIREKFENKENGSSILVANTKNSNIKSIETLDYLDRIKATLTNELNRNIKYASIYYIWNRDKDSNEHDITNKLLNIIDNDVYNGKLILNYPCIEVYELSNFNKTIYKEEFASSQIVKEKWSSIKSNKKISINKMDINTLQTAYKNMLNALKEFQIFNLDYPDTSKKVFQKEEEYFEDYQNYKALSLVSYIFYDLGIIE